MVDKIIDLRNKAQPAEWEEAKALAAPGKEAAINIEWYGREDEKKERSQAWFLGLGTLALALVLVAVFTKNYFFAAFVALAFITFIMYERRASPELHISISSEGVKIGKSSYRFSDLKSFWIFESQNDQELSLETKKTLIPFIRLPLKNVDMERVKMFLRNYLPEEEHKEFISDQIAKNI